MLTTILALFITYQAGLYGSYWDSQVNPFKSATIYLDVGEPITGELSRSWNGNSMKDANRTLAIPESNVTAITYTQNTDGIVHWRFWAPPMLILFSFLLYEIVKLFSLRKNKSLK